MRIFTVVLFPILAVALTGSAAGADQKWEVEVNGGSLLSSNPTAGASALPLPGASISSPPGSNLLGGARSDSSWYFGDGTQQFNQAVASFPVFRLIGPIIPLDSVLQSRFADRKSGGSFGVRVRRAVGNRISAEFGLHETFGRLAITSESIRGIEDSRLSFLSGFNALISGPAGGGAQLVSSDATIVDNRGRQTIATGALLVNLLGGAKTIPYLAIGGGYISNGGGVPSVRLAGNYHFVFPPTGVPPVQSFVIDQTDTVTVRVGLDNRPKWMLGGGVKYVATERWGITLDVRDYVGRDRQRTELDASPSTASAGSGAIIFGSMPPLFFSATPRTPSTLSGESIDRFKTFQGTGMLNQVHATAGVFWRF